ncbi:inducible metalloproteinase inhibitor protein-like isoform X2 [Pieris napi]|uniref:inducible metalloproteinase inhibitor protein-like isoform X2 n=1 Tax=Pieris napi TaxID=78633 RepID=UPI001FBA0AD5|nr:inducible metalloproteinase inhibitor protein-like isoform X2 [Pieris napi]
MFSICVFYYLFFLYCVPTLEAGPIECLSSDEHLQCVFPCPTSEVECVNGEIRRSCLNSAEPCTMQCVCKPGLYRSYLGDCLPEENCGKCGNHEFFSCGPECDNECSTLHEMNRTNCPILNIVCNEKCYCEDGFARNDARECIPVEECPNSYNRDMRSPKSHIHHEPLLCPPNEEYSRCKRSCPPETCNSLVAFYNCGSGEKCEPGCVCKSGFLRKNVDEPCTPIRECPQLASSPDFL